ncbi:MAG: hypothetical protein JXR69_07590 [Candidatus Delongbacteria bacterium]|nr:hypothetical protein [Candidatus Delongbacteria bacterium]
MLKKMTVALFSVLMIMSIFTACTDESDPVAPVITPDDTIMLTVDETIDSTSAFEFKVSTEDVTRIKIYWTELGSVNNSGETGDIQVSVLKMDGVSPYKIIANSKDFIRKDNSEIDDPKEVYVDAVEDTLIVKVEQKTVPGTFKLVVQKNPVIFSVNDSLIVDSDIKDYEVFVKNADKAIIYWQELGTSEVGNDKTANVQGSVYQMDWLTAYKQIENGKDFEDKDNSSWDNPKEILLDKGENFINVRIEMLEDTGGVIGTFGLFVVDTSDED